MVLFMEGSNVRDEKVTYSKCGGEPPRDIEEMIDSLVTKMPWELDRSFVCHLEELNITLLASGFFGEVYKAYHKSTDRTMVLKKDKLSKQEKSFCENDLMNEAAILSRMCHPSVIRFLGLCIGENEGERHLLIEYINGGNLEELLMNHDEVLEWGTRVYLARDIADGMSYLHQHKIIHRDLASKNCLIKIANGAKYAVIADFGLATYLPDNGEGVQTVVGSPYNMAPELLRGETYDNKADVFSFGILMCEIIGRVQADPEELPRTEAFGLDVEKFKAMVGDCPMEFLHTAVCCCQMDSNTRPSFSATLKHLEKILIDFPQRPELSNEPLSGEKTMEPYTSDNSSGTSNNWSSTTCSLSGSLLSPVLNLKDNPGHRHRSSSDSKRRISWISGRYKLFHTSTDDILKNTPAKLMGFFKNVMGLKSKELNAHSQGRKTPKNNDHAFSSSRSRSQSSVSSGSVSPLPDIPGSNCDLNKNQSLRFVRYDHDDISSVDGSPSKSISCPGTPGLSGTRNIPSSRRHTISPCSPVYANTSAPELNIGINSENYTPSGGAEYSNPPDVVSMSSGFHSMPDGSSICASSNEFTSFTESNFSSRTSSLRRQISLTEDEDHLNTLTCKNIKAPNFDRFGSYSVINAEATSKLALVKQMGKDKIDGLKSTSNDNAKTKKKMHSQMLLSFLLGNRGKSKDAS